MVIDEWAAVITDVKIAGEYLDDVNGAEQLQEILAHSVRVSRKVPQAGEKNSFVVYGQFDKLQFALHTIVALEDGHK